MKTLILGGARSGKSARAQRIAEAAAKKRFFIATAEAWDTEMAARIERHQADRGAGWHTVEAPIELAAAIKSHEDGGAVCLVDCLTLWLSNLMHNDRDVEKELVALCDVVRKSSSPLIFVSNEVGMGLVPETPLGREFRDAQGRLNQLMVAVCDRVEFVAAGLPLTLKG